jgi:hypothetical protein
MNNQKELKVIFIITVCFIAFGVLGFWGSSPAHWARAAFA